MILFIKHIEIEGPETIGTFFEERGFSSRVIGLNEGEKLPVVLDDIDAVISLGGPMNVYEEETYPFLREENVFIQSLIRENVPFMGICLGSQLLAKAAGGSVVLSPQKEIGFSGVRLTEEGKTDPLFDGLTPDLDVYQWHQDMSRLPDGARLLATSDVCPYQAFKVGSCAYGLQFHIEITDKSIREWSDSYFKDETELKEKKDRMLQEYNGRKTEFNKLAGKVYANFLKIIEQRKAKI